jgi:putative ABC transport system permease protein
LLLSLLGGLLGLFFAAWIQTVEIATANFQTFSELACQFKLTSKIAAKTLLYALFMGFLGDFIASCQAARIKIIDCLHAA